MFEVSRLKRAGIRISCGTLKCKHGIYESRLQHLCVYSRLCPLHFLVCNLLSFFYPPPSRPPKHPTHSSSASFFHSLSSYLKCSVLWLFFSVCFALFLSTSPFLLYTPSLLFFKLNVSLFSPSCVRVPGEADGFEGEDLSLLWAHRGTDRVKEGQRHTCTTHTNAKLSELV